MLELLPQSMPHALPREPSHDFFPKFDSVRQMQLPVPRVSSSHDLDALRTAPRPPLTPPSSVANSAVRVVSLPSNEGAVHEYGYQLPPIGNSRALTAHTSPTLQRQPQQQSSQDMNHQPRKRWSIAPNLRVPESISTPQEGLPQLAAEVTCLFWFENSTTLKQVLDGNSPRMPIHPLAPDAIPTTGFRKWVATILTTTQVAQNVILLALLFIYRLKNSNPTVKGKPGSEYRLLTVALMLGNKFLDDNTYTNKTWAEVSGISVQEVHIMEVEFLSNMRYSLYTSEQRWKDWHTILGKFGTFYDRASKMPASGAVSPVALYTPSLQVPHSFAPSPPTQQISPPISHAYSPARSHLSNAPLLAPQATSTVVSPIGALPELGPLTQRKRSADDTAEPPAKRNAFGFTPGPYSNAPLIPTLQAPMNRSFDAQSTVNRLPPLPSLSIPTPHQNPPVQVHNWSDLPLPNPGSRSMAMVFPPPVQWKPSATPTSTTPAPIPPQSYSQTHTPTADRSRQISPFPPSAGSSPVSASYSGQRQLSPSYFLNQRQSPYRPVRGVHTLLVPPPQTSIHNPARNIGYDQMQYQPLGRPTTERRAGLLPYMDQGAWPENNQYNQLPIPQQPIYQR
ncbi:hypothetical protein K491DRAFT_493813 [Lophiostoma macrostomum CBS 122681]|uniref:Cyclin-domain-containing protein n=1 Tax=Lophiostoma macrostomum CBS 122681 TaxID=1314788 RepID=A0A6A6T2V7_9PLEO|nr:hypothetical protein K491DRAFT_493813 [Lophiostoma macrostomum CBS 122681]